LVSDQFENELLKNILPFWITVAPDKENGGFYGQIGINNSINNDVPRTAVTFSRIVWTFSHAYLLYHKQEYLDTAIRAFNSLNSAFWDQENGGLFWSIDRYGKPVFDHKHFYAQAFGIYGFSEFFRATQNSQSIERAMQLFNIIEEHAFDSKYGGYIESQSREFRPIADMRLSEKDMNCKKSMNTMLHIIEAYANFLQVWDDQKIKDQLSNLISVFNQHVFDKNSHHLQLFFDEDWKPLSDRVSCGHDIESSWLLYEAAEMSGDQELIEDTKTISLELAKSVLTFGTNKDGSIIQEGTLNTITNPNKEWWPQAEAVVGFFNEYQISGDPRYMDAAQAVWNYIQTHFIDRSYGGWFTRVTKDGAIDLTSPKVGPWECPYHESRMCFEMIQRLQARS